MGSEMCIRDSINPPNLQGIWGATMTPPWSGDYTTNGNLPVVVSHYLQANTPELMLPLFDRLEAYMEDFKVNARELFNCQMCIRDRACASVYGAGCFVL